MSEPQITTTPASGKGKAGADFKKATDDLLESVTYDALARELGVSVSLVRQARVKDDALCHRSPPKGWEPAVVRLAKQKAEHFRRLAERLSTETECKRAASARTEFTAALIDHPEHAI